VFEPLPALTSEEELETSSWESLPQTEHHSPLSIGDSKPSGKIQKAKKKQRNLSGGT
jgi:hypothetical protein